MPFKDFQNHEGKELTYEFPERLRGRYRGVLTIAEKQSKDKDFRLRGEPRYEFELIGNYTEGPHAYRLIGLGSAERETAFTKRHTIKNGKIILIRKAA